MRFSIPALAVTSSWLLALASSISSAQSPAPAPAVTPPAAPAPAVSPAPASPAANPKPDPAKLPVRERQRTVYVPYTELEKVFTDDGKGVFLPYREFLALWDELTLKREAEDKPPPVDATIARGDYTGRVEGQTLVLEAKLSVESFKPGWQTLHLCDASSLGFAEVSTGKAVLHTQPSGTDLLLPEKGQYDITLRLMLPITPTAGRSTVALPLPHAAVTKVTLTVPGEGLEFQVKPAAAFTTRAVSGQTELSAFFGGSSFQSAASIPLLSWGAPQGTTTMSPLLLAETQLSTAIRAGTLATTARLDLRVLRAPLSEFRIGLPAGQEILGVTGEGIKTWTIAPASGSAGQQQLTLTLDKPLLGDTNFTLTLEGPIPSLPAQAQLPAFSIENASYARGTAHVSTEPQFDVSPGALSNVVRSSDTAETTADKLLPVGTFRLLRQPYSLALRIEEARPQVEVTSATRLEILRDTAKIEAQLTYDVKRVGIFETRIGLPAGFNLTSVPTKNIEWKVEGTAPAAQTLVVSLASQTKGEFTLNLIGKQLRTQPTEDIALPVFTPQNVIRHEGKIGVGVHSSLEASTKSLGDAALEDTSELPALGFGGRGLNADPFAQEPAGPVGFTSATTELSLAYRYRDSAAPAVLAFKSRDPQVSVQVLTHLDIKEQSTRHQWHLEFDIAYAAIDTLVIAVPKAIAKDLRFDPASLALIKETKKDLPADPAQVKALPDAASYDLWQITLRTERLGALTLSLSHEAQAAAPATGKTATIALLQLHVPSAFQEIGQLGVSKDNALELRNPQPEGLEEIDARELRAQLQRSGIVHAFKYRALPIRFGIDTAKNSYFAVPRAIITHAHLTTALASDIAQTTEALYWVRNLDLQFLVVQLPPQARLVSDIFVGRDPQQPMQREGSSDLLIRLPTGTQASGKNTSSPSQQSAIPVRFVYEVPSPTPGQALPTWGHLEVAPPTLPEVKIFETHHHLYLPASQHYTHFAGPLVETLRDRGWARVRTLIDPLLPALGPQLPTASQSTWSDPPAVPSDTRSLYDFQIPTQGQHHVLRRLGAPASIGISHRSRSLTYLLEGLVFLLTLGLGLTQRHRPASQRAVALILTAAAAILATGLLSPVNIPIATTLLLALAALLALWLAAALWSWLKHRRHQGPSRPGTNAPAQPQTPPEPQPSRRVGHNADERPQTPPQPNAPPSPEPEPPPSTSSSTTTTISSAPVQTHDIPPAEPPNPTQPE